MTDIEQYIKDYNDMIEICEANILANKTTIAKYKKDIKKLEKIQSELESIYNA